MLDGKHQILRRQAVAIVALLPDDLKDAAAVLDYAKALVTDWVGEQYPQSGEVVQFPTTR